MTINDILNAAAKRNAIIVPPATENDLLICQKTMTEKKLPPIPQEYMDFLRKCNGFVWDVKFYGTNQVHYPHRGDYTLRNIVSENEDFLKHHAALNDCVFLGMGFNNDYLLVYNTSNGFFEVVDRSDHDVDKEYETFEAMFIGVVEL